MHVIKRDYSDPKEISQFIWIGTIHLWFQLRRYDINSLPKR